jgi:outer membrane autotransporter protein
MLDSRFARICAWAVACLFASSFFSSSSAVAQACNAGSTNKPGTFLSLADQGGGFGEPSNIQAFLNANGLSGAVRVAKIDLGQAGDCDTNNGVTASAATNLSGFWTSNEQICAIAIHAGGGQRVAVFTYDPPETSGSWSTSQNLNNQGNQQSISNIQFFKCDQPTNNDKVALKVKKIALDGNGNTLNTDWSFNFSSPQIGSFPLTNTSPESVTFQIDKGATIEITEAEPAGFDFQDFSCTGPISINNPAPVRGVSFTVSNDPNFPADSEIVCTATNKKKPVGLVSIEKKVEGTGADTTQTFEFLTNLSQFSFHLSQDNSPKTFEIDANSPNPVTFTELAVNGYTLQSVSCTKNGANLPVNVQNNSITFDATTGDDIACTFVNRKDGGGETARLQAKKVILNPDGSVATNDPQTFEFEVAGTAVGPLGNGQTSAAVEVVADGSGYALSETPDPDYVLTSIDCGAAGQTTNSHSIDVTPVADDNILCTFTNRRKGGTLKVVKVALGGDGTFQFDVTGPANAAFNLQGGGFETITNAPAGNYTIAESGVPAGWILQDINCGRGTRTNDQIDFTLADGESVVCTFTNFKENDDPADDVTKVFIHRRVDNLLTHGPDRARVLRRLDEQPTGSLKDEGSYEPLKFTGSIKDDKGDVKFSTSLSQMRAAAAAADKKKISEAGLSFNDTYAGYYAPQAMTQRLDLWVEGQMTSYDDTTGGINRDGNFRILYTGMDYAMTPGILIGGLVQIDHTDEDVNNPNLKGTVEGTGWMAGPYLGLKLQESLFFDARAAWGKSSNDIDLTDNVVGRRTGSFETDRWLATATLTGNYYYDGLRISPHVGVAYGNEVSDAYTTSLGQNVGAADVTLGKVTFGPEFGYRTTLENGTTVEPHISLKGIWNFDGDTLELSSGPVKIDDFRAQIEGGVIVKSVDGYSFRAAGSYDGIGDSNLDAWSAKGWLNIPLD